MIRTLVAFADDQVRERICDLLERSGVSVRFRCRTGAEVLRAVKQMGSGVVICGYKLADMTCERLESELHELAFFLVIAKSTQLSALDGEVFFRLAAPVRAGELLGAVNMLLQLEQRRSTVLLPRRSEEERALVEQAKRLLMEKNSLSEEQAHRLLQKRSMESCMKLSETARLILGSYDA